MWSTQYRKSPWINPLQKLICTNKTFTIWFKLFKFSGDFNNNTIINIYGVKVNVSRSRHNRHFTHSRKKKCVWEKNRQTAKWTENIRLGQKIQVNKRKTAVCVYWIVSSILNRPKLIHRLHWWIDARTEKGQFIDAIQKELEIKIIILELRMK